MSRLVLSFFLIILTLPFILAQGTATDDGNHSKKVKAVTDRYDASNEAWRTNIIIYVLRHDQARLQTTLGEMKQFTATAISYVHLKRTGHEAALELYYRNLENISKLEQLKTLLEQYQKEYPTYTRDFLSKYGLTTADFSDFESFETAYENIMNRWRKEFESALQAGSGDDIRKVREDMKLLRAAVTTFILFPGKSANKVPQLQKMENDLRHAIVMLKMHEDTLQTAKKTGS